MRINLGELTPTTLILLILLVVILILYKELQRSHKRILEDEKYKNELYRNRDYKCKGIEYYSETRRERLIRIFDTSDAGDQQKIAEFAERLERNRENQRYM